MGILALLLSLSVGVTSAAPLTARDASALPTLSYALPAESVAPPIAAAPAAGPNVSGKYFGARYYGSKIGRFTTTDPVYTWQENLVDPQRWNRYAYARNNPLRYTDPDGRQTVPATAVLLTTADSPERASKKLDIAFGVAEGLLMTIVPGLDIQTNSPDQANGQLMGQGFALAGLVGLAARNAPVTKADAVRGETRFTAAGRRAHAEEPLPPGFERDVGLPSGRRMDGYSAADREVIEMKPNNPRAIRRGERQVQQYCAECDQVRGPGHTGRVQTYDQAKYLDNKK